MTELSQHPHHLDLSWALAAGHVWSPVCALAAKLLASLQVAAYADRHLCVRKSADSEGRVHTKIDALVDQAERAHEIAAMLGKRLDRKDRHAALFWHSCA